MSSYDDKFVGDFYEFNSGLRVSEFDGAEIGGRWLCSIERDDGGFYQFTISNDVLDAIRLFDGMRTNGEVFKRICDKGIRSLCEFEKFKKFVLDFLIPRKILVKPGDNLSLSNSLIVSSSPMTWSIKIFGPRVLNYILHFTSRFFSPWLLVGAFLYLAYLFYFYLIFDDFSFGLVISTPKEQLLTVLLVSLGLLVHEFGHASAAYKFGCRNVSIGIGWYVCFLVFYADLSESWRLNRKQRAIVDSGGLLFQAIFTVVLYVCFFETKSPSLYFAILVLNLSFLWNLNPFLRMDGYWIASDLLGVSNLGKVVRGTLKELPRKLFFKTTHRKALPYSDVVCSILVVYSIVSTVFMCWMSVFMFYRFKDVILGSIERVDVIMSVGLWSEGVYLGVANVVGFLFQLLLGYFIVYFITKTFFSFLFYIKSIYQKKL